MFTPYSRITSFMNDLQWDPNNEHSNSGTIPITDFILACSPLPDTSLLVKPLVESQILIHYSGHGLNSGPKFVFQAISHATCQLLGL